VINPSEATPALVSIVVPVFNGLPHLVGLTESILAQSHVNLEIIFSEGGGNDGSLDYLNTLTDPRITILTTPERITAAENWTKATNAATADYIKLICQDDLLTPDAVAKQLVDLTREPEAVMAIAQRDVVDTHGNVLYPKRGLTGLTDKTMDGANVIRTCYLQGTNVIGEPLAVLFKAKPLKGSMPWTDHNPLMLDLNTYQKVAPLGKVVLRHESVGGFRVSVSSWSTRLAKLQNEQTRQWQQQYALTAIPKITRAEKTRAFLGRHLQVSLRRAAYTVLKLKKSF